jgi:hypothetical protein
MAEVSGIAGHPSSTPATTPTARGESVRLSVPDVDDRAARTPRGASSSRAAVAAESREAPHVIRFEGRDLDPFAPRGTYLDITV